jgi:putative acetyltransferase
MIRPYRQENENAVIDIWYRASIVAHAFVPDDFWEGERENIRSVYLPLAETWVYEWEGRVIGFISLLGSLVGGLFIAPEHQGKGIGRDLIVHAVSVRGELTVDVFEKNHRACSFYESCGFLRESESLHEPTGCTNVTMRRVVEK